MKGVTVVVLGIIALMYLLNIGMGFIEIIPDNIPYVGNLDEGAAVVLLLMCLRYFGLDPAKLFEKDRGKQKEKERRENT